MFDGDLPRVKHSLAASTPPKLIATTEPVKIKPIATCGNTTDLCQHNLWSQVRLTRSPHLTPGDYVLHAGSYFIV